MQIISYMSGTPLQGSHIPYKVLVTIRVIDSYKVPIFYIRYGGTKRVIGSSCIPYKVRGTISH